MTTNEKKNKHLTQDDRIVTISSERLPALRLIKEYILFSVPNSV